MDAAVMMTARLRVGNGPGRWWMIGVVLMVPPSSL
jgi:hypothetical protein